MGLKEPPELEGGGQAHMKSLAFAPSSFNNSKNEETDASLSFFFYKGSMPLLTVLPFQKGRMSPPPNCASQPAHPWGSKPESEQ